MIDVGELTNRLENAALTLTKMSVDKGAVGHDSDYDGLRGKADGARLALSYIREMMA